MIRCLLLRTFLTLYELSTRAWAPVNVGIHSVIQRCRLLVGTKTISEIDDFNHYMAYKSAFMSNEHQKQREQVTSGRMIAHKVYYDNGSNVSGAGQSNTSASYIGLDTGMNVSATASGTVVSEQSDLPSQLKDDFVQLMVLHQHHLNLILLRRSLLLIISISLKKSWNNMRRQIVI